MPESNGTSRPEELRKRTKQFALRIVKLFKALPKKEEEARILGRQLLRSGTSVGANYRAVCLARSRKEFASKMNVVLEEADEAVFWIEVLIESNAMSAHRLTPLLREAQELSAIFGASLRTARRSMRASNSSISR